mgnify:CR=1 FL=1
MSKSYIKIMNDFLYGLFSGFEEEDFETRYSLGNFKKPKIKKDKKKITEIALEQATNPESLSLDKDEYIFIAEATLQANWDLQILLDKDLLLNDGASIKVGIACVITVSKFTDFGYESGKILGIETARKFKLFESGIPNEVVSAMNMFVEQQKINVNIIRMTFSINLVHKVNSHLHFDYTWSLAGSTFDYLPETNDIVISAIRDGEYGRFSIELNKKNINLLRQGVFGDSENELDFS